MDDIDIDLKLTDDIKAYTSNKDSKLIKYKCNNTNLLNIDLNNIKLKKIGDSDCDNINKNQYFDKTKTYKLIYNDTELCNIQYISEGSYGTVYKYSDKSNKYNVAVKNYYNSTDDEIKIYKLLITKGVECNVVNMKIIQYRPYFSKYFVGVMDYMHGTLSDLKGKLDSTNFLKVIKSIAESLKCLQDNDLSYTDLKTDNILYKCVDKKLK